MNNLTDEQITDIIIALDFFAAESEPKFRKNKDGEERCSYPWRELAEILREHQTKRKANPSLT